MTYNLLLSTCTVFEVINGDVVVEAGVDGSCKSLLS